MRSFSDELYHYGVKGMKWGVHKEDDRPSGSGAKKTGQNSNGPKKGSPQHAIDTTKKVNGWLNSDHGKKTTNAIKDLMPGEKFGKSGIPKSQKGRQFLANEYAKNMYNERLDSAKLAGSGVGYSKDVLETINGRNALMAELRSEALAQLEEADEWAEGGKDKYIREMANKGKSQTEIILNRLKGFSNKMLSSASAVIEKGKKAVGDFLTKSLNIKEGKTTYGFKQKSESKLDKALNIKSTGLKTTTGKPASSFPKFKPKSTAQQKIEKFLNVKERERRIY